MLKGLDKWLNQGDNYKKFGMPRIYDTTFGHLLEFKDLITNIDVEIGVNKTVEPYNSKLVYTYSMIDERFQSLALVLKKWNKMNFPDKTKRINSYSLVLMLIGFMIYKK